MVPQDGCRSHTGPGTVRGSARDLAWLAGCSSLDGPADAAGPRASMNNESSGLQLQHNLVFVPLLSLLNHSVRPALTVTAIVLIAQ